MKSKNEIKRQIEQYKSMFFDDSLNQFQKIIICTKINTLKWVIDDISDDSWMFGNYEVITNNAK